jgi:DNA invertase Pin-like site-specific DNA recombinase
MSCAPSHTSCDVLRANSSAFWNRGRAVIGYARVSTAGQELQSQIGALEAAGCAKVFSETASGVRSDRKQLAKALATLRQGDVLIVTRLDRLARSTRDLLNVLDHVARAGASLKSLADTRPTPPRRTAGSC